MKNPDVIIDEDGTTWIEIGEHSGKTYYGKPEIFELPKTPLKISLEPEPMPHYHFADFFPSITTDRTIKVTGI